MSGKQDEAVSILTTPRGRTFEMFMCQDGFIELYDADNPKEGMCFDELNDLLEFIETVKKVLGDISDGKKGLIRTAAVRTRS